MNLFDKIYKYPIPKNKVFADDSVFFYMYDVKKKIGIKLETNTLFIYSITNNSLYYNRTNDSITLFADSCVLYLGNLKKHFLPPISIAYRVYPQKVNSPGFDAQYINTTSIALDFLKEKIIKAKEKLSKCKFK
jgi:hypothetical protein